MIREFEKQSIGYDVAARRRVLDSVQPHYAWLAAAIPAVLGLLGSMSGSAKSSKASEQAAAQAALGQKAQGSAAAAAGRPPVSQMAAQRADVTSNPDVLEGRLRGMQLPGVGQPAQQPQPAPFTGGNQTGQFAVPPAGAGNTAKVPEPNPPSTGGLTSQDYLQMAQMAGGLLGQANQPIQGVPPGQPGQPLPSTAYAAMQRRRRYGGY